MENIAESLKYIKTIKEGYLQLRAFKRLERRVGSDNITNAFQT